ncbi:OmpA family protein [Pseudomonas sp. LPB0260]|uniref:OmpA family protein n=1 Tax=Pseudomonas sp. LPB0260 TaxID=2614442 RepID=UPI0015C28A31|nr:OmpA family protein [Pseudomonas sp. LPB0260]QLC74555.1 OmpA family protein [Pseudomonas sp. LPB0260]QLC77324.1 OmpA family protein [Pseudomonas sp. LPB0260]
MKGPLLMTGASLLLLLGGCAGLQPSDGEALEAARASFQTVKEDPAVLRSAAKDVIRAGESLARADRLSSYWGSADDVSHYAYLSQRYSDIAAQKSVLGLNQERAARLELERQRLQLALREAKLLSIQEQSHWLEEQMLSLATTETERGLVMTLGDVLFDAGHADLNVSANRTVLKLVQFLQLNPRRVVRIEGYSDSRGDKQENLELSRARAQTVADVLIDLGIDAKRIEVQGYGEAFPVAENASAKGRARNRRVEIVFSDEQGRLGAPR